MKRIQRLGVVILCIALTIPYGLLMQNIQFPIGDDYISLFIAGSLGLIFTAVVLLLLFKVGEFIIQVFRYIWTGHFY